MESSVAMTTSAWKGRVLSGTLRKAVLKQRDASLQTSSLTKTKLLPPTPRPGTVTPFARAQCSTDQTPGHIRSMADRPPATEPPHCVLNADSCPPSPAPLLDPDLWTQALGICISPHLPGGPSAPQHLSRCLKGAWAVTPGPGSQVVLLSQFHLGQELSWAASEKTIQTSPRQVLGAGDSETSYCHWPGHLCQGCCQTVIFTCWYAGGGLC